MKRLSSLMVLVFLFNTFFALPVMANETPKYISAARAGIDETRVGNLKIFTATEKINLGEPIKSIQTNDDYGNIAYRDYYKGLEITTTTGYISYIAKISITSSKYKTVRGITVGSSVTQVKKAYGNKKLYQGYLSYTYKGKDLDGYPILYYVNFKIKNNKVSQININYYTSETSW